MKKIPASSLLEVLVAGVLLCIIVSISLVTFTNVMSSAPSFRQHQLDVLLQARIDELRRETLVVHHKTDTMPGGSTLVENVAQYQNTKNLFVIDLEVTDAHGRIEADANVLHYQYDEEGR